MFRRSRAKVDRLPDNATTSSAIPSRFEGDGGDPSHDSGDGDRRLARLGELGPGATGTIKQLSCRGKLRRRLMDIGIVAGTPFEVERVAPLGDPVELKVKGVHLSLRREEAGDIWVEVSEDGR